MIGRAEFSGATPDPDPTPVRVAFMLTHEEWETIEAALVACACGTPPPIREYAATLVTLRGVAP